MGMLGKWAIPVFASILVFGFSYPLDTQSADAHSVCNRFSPSACGDGNVCTTDKCDFDFIPPATIHEHCSNIPNTKTCNDGNVCTSSDICSAGACVGGANVADGTSCADANACNGDETCQSGACTAGTQLNCNDDIECTDDICVPASGCVNDLTAIGTVCGSPGDGLCDLQDTCDGLGACINEVAQDTVSCRAAGNDCDAEEFCDGAGSCTADALEPEGTVCGDTVVVGVNQNCNDAGICVISSAIECGEGTELVDGVCEANICEAKLDVCHKGKTTMNISLNALPTHLNHGDTVGACE